jgi:hypothetical protein
VAKKHENSRSSRHYSLKSYRNGNIHTPLGGLFVFTSLSKEETSKDIFNSETLYMSGLDQQPVQIVARSALTV